MYKSKADPSLVSGTLTQLAPCAVDGFDLLRFFRREPHPAEKFRRGRDFLHAPLTNASHQTLGTDRVKRRRNQKRFDPHVNQPGDRTRGVVGVQGGQYHVTRQGRLDSNLRSLDVPNLTY